MRGYLQQRHLMHLTLLERGARLCVEAQHRLFHEVIHSLVCIPLRENDNDSSTEMYAGQRLYLLLVVFV